MPPLSTIKVLLGPRSKYVAAPRDFDELCRAVREVFCMPADAPLTFRYRDDEGDLVTLASNAELEAALELARGRVAAFELHIVEDEALVASMAASALADFVVVSPSDSMEVAASQSPPPPIGDLLGLDEPQCPTNDAPNPVPALNADLAGLDLNAASPSADAVADAPPLNDSLPTEAAATAQSSLAASQEASAAASAPEPNATVANLSALPPHRIIETMQELLAAYQQHLASQSPAASTQTPAQAPPPPAPAPTSSERGPEHVGVTCDHCRRVIVGVRYKCGHCRDYDLCETCEPVAPHDPLHVLLKIKRPIVMTDAWAHIRLLPPFVPLEVAAAASAVASAAASTPSAAPASGSQPMAELVEQATQPTAPQLPAGSTFVKSWTLRNSGACAWPDGVVLQQIGGDRMGPVTQVPVPRRVAPGEKIVVEVDLVAPKWRPAKYTSTWRLALPSGVRFGHVLTCDVFVAAPPADEAEGRAASPDSVAVRSAYYLDELERLKAMGLCNRAENLRLLRKYNGDVARVVQELVDDVNNWR